MVATFLCPDRCYARFTLWNDMHAADSSYVCRVRDNSAYDIVEDPDVHGDHRVPVDFDSHGPRTGEAYVRNDLPLHVGLGIAGRTGTAY